MVPPSTALLSSTPSSTPSSIPSSMMVTISPLSIPQPSAIQQEENFQEEEGNDSGNIIETELELGPSMLNFTNSFSDFYILKK